MSLAWLSGHYITLNERKWADERRAKAQMIANQERKARGYLEDSYEQSLSAAKEGKEARVAASERMMAMLEGQAEQYAPWQQAGQEALGQYSNLLAEGAGDYKESDAYQASLRQGANLMGSRQAIGGNFFSGEAMRDLADYGREARQSDYDRHYSRYAQQLSQQQQGAAMGMSANQMAQSNLGQQMEAIQYGSEGVAAGAAQGANVMQGYSQQQADRLFTQAAADRRRR